MIHLPAERVAFLLDELDEPPKGRADEATAELIASGELVLERLLIRVETLGRLGQLCAIEIIEALSATLAIPALRNLLASEHDTVREWAARALGELGAQEAVPELAMLMTESRRRGTPPGWTEPVAIRHALTKLGARDAVIPSGLAASIIKDKRLTQPLPDSYLEEALSALGDAEQVVLYYQRWRPSRDTWIWTDGQSWELDWSSHWPALVAESRQLATEAARSRTPDDSAVVTIEWMSKADWPDNSEPSNPGSPADE